MCFPHDVLNYKDKIGRIGPIDIHGFGSGLDGWLGWLVTGGSCC
jgi:hypothetical protein